MSGPFLSAQSFFALAKEVTRGTAVTPPTIFLPISPNPTLTPNLTWVEGDYLVGSPVKTLDKVPSVRFDEYSCKGFVFADTFPNLMMGVLGGADTKTGTVAPYTHTIPLLNTAAAGSQPPSYTGYDIDQAVQAADAAKQFAGGQISEVEITFAVTGALNWTTKFVANPFAEVAVPTSSFSTEVFIPAWSATVTIAGVASGVLDSGKFTIKRTTKSIFALGKQGPIENFANVVQVTGDFTFIVLSTDATLTKGLKRTHQVVKLTFTDPISTHSVEFQMSTVQFFNPKIERSKPEVQVTTSFEAVANTTDAATGFSPIKFIAVNAQSTLY